MNPQVAIYSGKGVTCGHLWHAYPLEKNRINYRFISEKNLPNLEGIDVITFPSGGLYFEYISDAGKKHLQELIRNGVGYLGTCGGNVFGTKLGLLDIELLYRENGYPKNIPVNGFPELKQAPINKEGFPRFLKNRTTLSPFYFMGQAFKRTGKDVTVLYSYDRMDRCFYSTGKPYSPNPTQSDNNSFSNLPAMVCGKYGEGNVVLSGPHPEVGEENVYVQIIKYLSRKDETAASKEGPNRKKRSSKNSSNSPQFREQLDTIISPYEQQLTELYNNRWNQNKTIGLPPFLLLIDTMKLINSEERWSQSLFNFSQNEKNAIAKTLEQSILRFIRSLELLKTIDIEEDTGISESLQTQYYTEYSRKLSTDLKALNLRLRGYK